MKCVFQLVVNSSLKLVQFNTIKPESADNSSDQKQFFTVNNNTKAKRNIDGRENMLNVSGTLNRVIITLKVLSRERSKR